MSRRMVGLLALGLALLAVPGSPAATPAGGTFLVAEPSTYVSSIDGAAVGAGDVALSAACASLMRLADRPLPAGYRLVPELAARFPRISPDGKTYVFSLRKGARFSTGAPVTAADVAFTINRILTPAVQSPNAPLFADVFGAPAVIAGRAKTAAGIRAAGDTLTIRLGHPDGGFLANAATSLCVLPAGLQAQAGGLSAPVPSAAPYFVSEYVPGQRLVLDRNRYYSGPRPQHVDRFVFDLTPDENQALDEARDGKVDYAWVPNIFYAPRANEFARMFGVNKGRFYVEPGTFLRMFVLNTSRPLLRDNAPLRQAINFAVDRPALLQQQGAFAGRLADHYVLPIMPGYRNVHPYPLQGPNLARARKLARGHLRSGTLVLYALSSGRVQAEAQIVKRDLARIGLRVRIRVFPAGGLYFGKLTNPKEPFDMAWIGWETTSPDPGTWLSMLFDGGLIGKPTNADLSYFDSPAWNAAMRRAARLTGEARYVAFEKLDIALASREAPAVAFSVDNALTLVSARTGCVVANPYLDLAAVCLK